MLKKLFSDLKAHLAKLRETIAPMPFKKKVEHIWMYYKEVMYCALMVVIICIAIVSSISNAGKTIFYAGSTLNVQMNLKGYDYLTTDFLAAIGANPDENIQLINNEYDDNPEFADFNDNYYSYVQIEAMIAGDNLQYLLMDENAMKFYCGRYLLMDLREVFTEEEMEQWHEKIIWVTFEDDEKLYPLAVDISGTEFGQNCLFPNEGTKVFIGFGDREEKMDLHRQMWDHILNWKSAA